MIPVSLTIKGLYSYQQETTIDFTKLTEAGLFGIFGSVGSGKSTILEAITFALYGDTERLGVKNDNRNYNMMNLRSKDLKIDFTFTCGDCNDTYRFTATAKRNGKRFSDVGTIERKGYIWNDAWVPTAINAEKILGLSYDNFKRTIIIPQGKFQEFLQLNNSDRVDMLKEIFGLQKFELGPKVLKLIRDNENKVNVLQGQMLALPLFDVELLKEKEQQLQELDNGVKSLSDSLQNKQKEEKALQDLKTLFTDLQNKTASLDGLKSKEKSFDELDRQVKQFEQCESVFMHPFENRKKLYQSILLQQSEAQKLQNDKNKLEAIIETESGKVEKLKDAYASREQLLQKAVELEKIISIKTLQEGIAAINGRIEKGSRTVNDEETLLTKLNEQISTIKLSIISAEGSLPDTALLVSISNWFHNLEQLKSNVSKTERDVLELKNKVAKSRLEIETKLQELPNEIHFQIFPASLADVKNRIDALMSNLSQQLKQLVDEQNHLKVSQGLNQYAKALTEGAECPLCGSIHHPNIYSAKSVTEELVQKQKAIDDIEAEKSNLNSALYSFSSPYAAIDSYTTQHNQKHKELLIQNESLQKFNDTFSFTGYSLQDADKVKNQLAEIEQKNNEIKKLRKQRDDKDKEIEDCTRNITKYKAAVDKLRTDLAQQEGQLQTLENQIQLHTLEVEILKPVAELASNASLLQTQHAQVTRAFEQAQKVVQESTNSLAALNGRWEELQKQITQNVTQREEFDQQIAELLYAEGYNSEQEVEQVLATKLDIKKEKDKVEKFKQELHTATIQLQEATAKVEGKEYNTELHTSLLQTITVLSNELKANTEKSVAQRLELQQLNENMQARQTLQKDLDKLVLRAENLKVLGNLFRSSGFVNYVSSVYLQNLINSANQRFHKMTRQKLLLELADDNSFRVRDFMNNGEVRSVKTLSGGQTFQAALSLALALADNIQHLTKSKQNFFFLDEGFGSLDKDALAIVFDTLKSLRKENRIVGVISHVDEMQQEIQVNLKVVNDPEHGSMVTNSWS